MKYNLRVSPLFKYDTNTILTFQILTLECNAVYIIFLRITRHKLYRQSNPEIYINTILFIYKKKNYANKIFFSFGKNANKTL